MSAAREYNLENSEAQMRKGTLELAVLLLISKKAAYATDILESLKENKIITVEGTLYPLLNRLEKTGVLSYSWKESAAGPPRKYYVLTKTGREILEELVDSWKKFNRQLVSIIKKHEKSS